jgi:hypothetical protein
MGFTHKNGRDFSSIVLPGYAGRDQMFISIERTEGQPTDFGVVIRQEKTLFPGVLLVRRVDDFYPCYSLDATSAEFGITVTDKRSECKGFSDQRRVYRLRPFIYF